VQRTLDKALRKLKGRFGLKRFLRDGCGTVVEDRSRKYYKPAEIKVRNAFNSFSCLLKLNYILMSPKYLLVCSLISACQQNKLSL
jgi:hypothetical protein